MSALPPTLAPLVAPLSRALGAEPRAAVAVTGGDINRAFRLTLSDGRVVFLKTPRTACAGVYAAEAAGLRFLWQAAPGLQVPAVLSHSDAGAAAHLALAWLEPTAGDARFEEQLGAGLAAMHARTLPRFGGLPDNFIATLPQDNRPCTDWPTFYAERRLRPMLHQACRKGAVSVALRHATERLLQRMSELLACDEAPCPVHGDLWSGNAMASTGGPALFDPAAYAGQREVDLSMMHLFGGFARRTFEAYEHAYPLAPGHQERLPLYQLYPVLVHVTLFGGHYVTSAERIVRRYVG